MIKSIQISLTCLFLMACSGAVLAQDGNEDETPIVPSGRNNWYVELGGSSLFYSLNYEKYLYETRKRNFTWVARIGMGYNPSAEKFLNTLFIDKKTFIVPFTSTIFLGSGNNKLELGGGFTMLTSDFLTREVVPNYLIGLRVMDPSGLTFRFSYVGLIRDGNYNNWIGVSIGKNFNFK